MLQNLRFRLTFFTTGTGIVVLIALAIFVLHMLTNHNYGFHRDELATLDDARYLAWGYVAYPPVTPFFGRLSLELFGPSLTGFRMFSALAQSIAVVLAGLMARELGGGRLAQVVAALTSGTSPAALFMGASMMYVTFDHLWWILIAYLVIRMLKSDSPRWWLAIGAVIGLGMMTKYTMAFWVAGIMAGVALTRNRRHLLSPWLWGGVGLSLLIFLPNLIWQIQHDFVSLGFLSSIHARDIQIGRTQDFLLEQLYMVGTIVALPMWIAGLYYVLFSPSGQQWRMLGWMYVVTFAVFFAAQGRGYYLAPAYPMLVAAGAARGEAWLKTLSAVWSRVIQGATWALLAVGTAAYGSVMLPIAPINSPVWDLSAEIHDVFTEQIGWDDLTKTVADIYHALPPEERARTGILAGNYGEAGAINLYGPQNGLPTAISGINSYWLRGYGDPPPEVVIAVGFDGSDLRSIATCKLAGHNTNRYGVKNEETEDHPDIFVCRDPKFSWPELWENFQYFG